MPWIDAEHPDFVTDGLHEMVKLHTDKYGKAGMKCKGVYFTPTVSGFYFRKVKT